MITKEEIKILCDTKMQELEPYFKEIYAIAQQFYSSADVLSYKNYEAIENKLVGIYVFLNITYKELSALADTFFAIRFNQLKVKAEVDNIKFVAEVAKNNADEFIEDIRLASAKLEGWVSSVEQLLITCRKHIYSEKKEYKYGEK